MIFIKMGSIRFWSRLKSDKSTFLTPLKKRNRLRFVYFKNFLAAIGLGTLERMPVPPYLYKKKMRSFLSQFKLLGMVLLGISAVIVFLFYNALQPQKKLRVYSPAMVNEELVAQEIQHIRKYHTIADFSLTNQNGQTITQADYKGKIYVADFFFTTCPTICPIMTKNMAAIQTEIIDDPEVMLLSHSVTPEIDSVAQLKKYALEKGVDDVKWNLVTGPKKEIYELARKSYLAVKTDGDGGPYDMIHTENFILVDKEKRIRGFYDGTKEDDIKKLLEDLKILKQSYLN